MVPRDLLYAAHASVPSFAAGVVAAALLVPILSRPPSAASTEISGVPLRTDAVARVARDRARSVVLLHAVMQNPHDSPQPNWLKQPVREALGSGIVIDNQGLILTNAHVIESAGQIHVRRPDGEDVETTVVGTDPETDLALVRVSDPSGLTAAPLGDSDRLDVGSFVIAIGSPLGLHHTVTVGVLSAKARGLDDSGLDFLQTDAAVNPGSSGGPLFDLSGRVIGVMTAIVSAGGENVGLNFAIPINTVTGLLPALRENRVTHAWLGITVAALTAAGARAVGLPRASEGLLITAIDPDSPAAKAGVRRLDVLLGLGGNPPVPAADVYRRLRTLSPGARVTLRVLSEGNRIDLPVVLGTRPPAR